MMMMMLLLLLLLRHSDGGGGDDDGDGDDDDCDCDCDCFCQDIEIENVIRLWTMRKIHMRISCNGFFNFNFSRNHSEMCFFDGMSLTNEIFTFSAIISHIRTANEKTSAEGPYFCPLKTVINFRI